MKRNFEGGELLKDIGREGWMKRYWKGGMDEIDEKILEGRED